MNRINGGWTTAVKMADCRTARTAAMQPMTYSTAKALVSSRWPDAASKAKPATVAATAISTAPHHGTPGMAGWAERLSAGIDDLARSADTRRPYRLYLQDGCQRASSSACRG